jgi:hypothetical protein
MSGVNPNVFSMDVIPVVTITCRLLGVSKKCISDITKRVLRNQGLIPRD